MRVGRYSLWSDPDHAPTTGVVRDADVVDTLESLRISARQAGSFLSCDIFAMPEHEVCEASLVAGQRMQERLPREKQQAILYFWTVEALRSVGDHSFRFPGPCPLTREEVVEVFEQVAEHPEYRGQKLATPDCDDRLVVLDNGRVED